MSERAVPAGLPDRAKLYMAGTALAAAAVCAVALVHGGGESRGWETFLVLAAAASITQLFAFHTIRNQVFHTTPLFFVAGAILLQPEYALLLPLISHIGDWIRQRYAWYIQTFNILNFTLSVTAAWLAARIVSEDLFDGTGYGWAAAGVAAALVYVAVNNAGFAAILYLARGHSPRSILTPQILGADGALAALGVAFATFWVNDPWLLPFAVAPVYLLHQALHLPQLQEEARVDAKTGLFNARHFGEGLEAELARARRFGRPLSVILADLDLLRNINGMYGHLAGDSVLRGIADTIRSHLREYDIGARLGGEEFAIALPETTRERALEIAERLREAVATTPFWAESAEVQIVATLSIGVATFPEDGTEPAELVHSADLASFAAKLQGRNRVRAATKETVLIPVGRISAAAALLPEQPPGPTVAEPDEERRRPHYPKRLGPAVILVAALGVAAGAVGAVLGGSDDLLGLFALAAFVAFAHLGALQLEHGAFSVSAAGVLAGAALFGPRAALPLAVVIAGVDWGVRRLPLREIVLDVGAVSLGSLAAAGLFAAAPGGRTGDLVTLALGAPAGALFFTIVAAVYGLAAAAEGRESWWRRWRTLADWALPHYALWGLVGGLLAVAYRRAELVALAAFAVPLLALRETQSTIVRRAKANAEELRNATEAIQTQTLSLDRVQRLLRERSSAAIEGLCAIAEARDTYSAGHSQRVRDWALLIGAELGMSISDLEALGHAALFHDIGKLAVPDSVLTKPGALSEEDWKLMRQHPEEGARIIERFGFRDDAVEAVRYHHERIDGTGYPEGLRGDDIPVGARIIQVANAYDSMRSPHVYQRARSEQDALEELQRHAGTQFDVHCVGAFDRVIAAGPHWRNALNG